MDDFIFLEETIRTTLAVSPQGLSCDVLENYVVGILGRSGDPVELNVYEDVLDSLVKKGIVIKALVEVESYEPGSTELVKGYQLAKPARLNY